MAWRTVGSDREYPTTDGDICPSSVTHTPSVAAMVYAPDTADHRADLPQRENARRPRKPIAVDKLVEFDA
jgi:hypothetical protein